MRYPFSKSPLCAVLLTLLATPAWSGWQPAVVVEAGGAGRCMAAVQSSLGTGVVAWQGSSGLRARLLTSTGIGAGVLQLATVANSDCPLLAILPDGSGALLWNRDDTFWLRRFTPTGSFAAAVSLRRPFTTISRVGMAMTPDAAVWIVWAERTKLLARRIPKVGAAGAVQTLATIQAPATFARTQLVTATGGAVIVSWVEESKVGTAVTSRLKSRTRTAAGVWAAAATHASRTENGYGTLSGSLSAGPGGDVMLSWLDRVGTPAPGQLGDFGLKAAFRHGGAGFGTPITVQATGAVSSALSTTGADGSNVALWMVAASPDHSTKTVRSATHAPGGAALGAQQTLSQPFNSDSLGGYGLARTAGGTVCAGWDAEMGPAGEHFQGSVRPPTGWFGGETTLDFALPPDGGFPVNSAVTGGVAGQCWVFWVSSSGRLAGAQYRP